MRRILSLLILSGLIGLIYYLFFRQHEFEVKLKAKTLPGDIIETIRIWNRSLEQSEIVKVDSFQRVKQKIRMGEREYVYDWNFQSTDSLSKIKVKISEPRRSILNKILVPFTEQPIESDASRLLRTFNDILQMHLKITKVKIIGEAELDSTFCVCSSLETRQIEKANGMMKDFPAITSFIHEMNLKPSGLPMVWINDWNHNAGTLKFKFCFPIERTSVLPPPNIFSYQMLPQVRALKAEYFGNYITSDRAWYELLSFADRNGFQIAGLPIERFHNNPNLGIKEHEWKAEVYLPIK